MQPDGYQMLAAKVLKLVVNDIKKGGKLGRKTEKELLRGDYDLWIETLELDMTRKEFYDKIYQQN